MSKEFKISDKDFWEDIENLEIVLALLDHGSELYNSLKNSITKLTEIRKGK